MLDPVCQKVCDVWEALRVVYSYSVSGEDIQQKLNELLTSTDIDATAQMRQSDIKLFLNDMYNIFYLTLRIEKKRNVLSTRLNFVRPKIGIKEKQLGKRQKYQKHCGNNIGNMKKHMGKWEKRLRNLPLGGYLHHLVTNFQTASYITSFSRELLLSMLIKQINT